MPLVDLPFSLPPGVPGLINAAGTVKTAEQAESLLRAPVPAIMMGSFTLEERPGNPGTTYFEAPLATLNSLGLPGPDISVWTKWISTLKPGTAEGPGVA